MIPRHLRAFLLLLFTVLLSHTAVAFPASPDDAAEVLRDAYGGAVLIAGDDILVGEYSGFSNTGMVHVLRENERASWNVVQTLTSSDAAVGDRFGSVIVGSADRIAVSSPGALDGHGAVYVFERSADGTWTQTARLTTPAPVNGSGFGSSVAFHDRHLFIGAPASADRVGVVHAYEHGEDGWAHAAELAGTDLETGSDLETGALFGSSLALAGGRLIVGAPGVDNSKGALYVYDPAAPGAAETVIMHDEAETGTRLGTSLTAVGDRVFASNARVNRGKGVVYVLQANSDGSFTFTDTMTPDAEGDSPAFFGASVTANADEVWIGAPLDNDGAGAVYRFDRESLSPSGSILNEDGGGRTQFGSAVAVGDEEAVVGLPGADYGLGSAAVYVREGSQWNEVATYDRPASDLAAIKDAPVECDSGEAKDYACQNVDLISFVPLSELGANRGVRLNDVWGWTDPETGAEIGIIGHMEAAVFVDLSNPEHPVVLGELPRTEGSPGSTWRDMKVYKDHVFIVADGAGQHGMQVFDLTRLRDHDGEFRTYEPDVLYDGIASSHNIVINQESGYAYTVGNSSGGETCGGGLHMINIVDPKNPEFVGCFNDPKTGNNGSGATHDAQCVTYDGPDAEHRGKEICVGSNGTAISIADVSDKDNPIAISQGTYPNSAYVHQGWFTDDHRYFYQNDEADELSGTVDRTRTMIWDLSDLDEPEMIAEFYGDTNSTDHNLYVDGDVMYQTNNASGLRVIDIRDRANPVEVGYFDTTPENKNVAGFDGTWS
ncbi:MAG: choice-of-anchor B family protein, partial [Rhodothermales bacterium]|nr:choice-of-anchor B family protein [Rhodothermales bacterium]